MSDTRENARVAANNLQDALYWLERAKTKTDSLEEKELTGRIEKAAALIRGAKAHAEKLGAL